ncbi:glycosyltransferase family 4 protein [Marinoscillum furvescens]|nr:glycosyltransferase family 4 protein [Marinoscillum furvescens]
MKILFTTHQGNLAGATFSLFYLATGLAKRGHEVSCACGEDTLLRQMLAKQGIVKTHDISFKSYLDFRSFQMLGSLATAEKYDVICAQGGRDRNLTIMAKWIYRLQSFIIFTRRQRPRNEPWIKRWYHIKGTAAIVMVSHGLKKLFVSKGYPPKHLPVIHNGVADEQVDPDLVELLRKKYQLNGRLIGCVARKKRQIDLIRALEYLPEACKLLLVGVDEKDFSDVDAFVNNRGRIVCTGLVSNTEARALLSLMDVHVLPSHMDGFGLSTVEAMLLKVPVIGSDFGGIPDVINDGKTGLLYQNGDVEGLASKINSLLGDIELKKRLVEEAYVAAKSSFNLTKTVTAYESLFQSLLSTSR